jgi:chromate reductase
MPILFPMNKPVNIPGFAGSLRKGSYNKAILRAVLELLPKDAKLEIFNLEGIPLFNQDLEKAIARASS